MISELIFTNSSNLERASFSMDAQPTVSASDVTFAGGMVYRYFGIPESLFEAWGKAESAGKFFHAFIKGKYTSVKLECFSCQRRILNLDDLVIVDPGNTPFADKEVLRAWDKKCYEAVEKAMDEYQEGKGKANGAAKN